MNFDIVSPVSPYHPLKSNEIRLALIESSSDDEGPLCVRLLPVNIQAPPTYDAISYVWGDDTATRCRVTNLSATAVVVWADALCINQLDLVERGAQVALMGQIYANARTVLVCMGPDLSGGGGGHVASLLREWQASAAAATTMNINTDVYDERWLALGALTGAPWFERMWVLQEVGLARDPRVIYGRGRESGGDGTDGPAEEFSYRLLRHVVAWTRQRAPNFAAYMGIGGLHIHDWWSDWSQPRVVGESPVELKQPSHYQFLDLLDHGALLKCHDPRDRIYAFLGHPLAAAAGPIVPDYAKPKIQVYQETTILLLRDSGVRTLSSVEHNAQTIEEDVPSWVVRWDVTPTFNNIWSSHNHTYRSGAGLIMGEFLALNGNVLQVEGVVVDSISAVFPVRVVPSQLQILFTSASADHWQHLAQFASELEQNTIEPFAYSTTAKVAILAHTLCGHLWDGQDQGTELLRLFSDYISRQRGSQDIAQTAGPFYWRAESLCRGRAFIITSKGYYGLASAICRPGDVCAIVKEGAVPLLLRPQSLGIGSGDGSTMPRRLIGEMYLHGFMEGYAASLVQEGKLRQELLRIR
ncbi:HET-domain-containing protein [Apiospora arundinis]